jgi:hypothetical protein
MWVTSRKSLDNDPATFCSYPHLNIRKNNAFRSAVTSKNDAFKNGEAAHLITNCFSLQAGIKPP